MAEKTDIYNFGYVDAALRDLKSRLQSVKCPASSNNILQITLKISDEIMEEARAKDMTMLDCLRMWLGEAKEVEVEVQAGKKVFKAGVCATEEELEKPNHLDMMFDEMKADIRERMNIEKKKSDQRKAVRLTNNRKGD